MRQFIQRLIQPGAFLALALALSANATGGAPANPTEDNRRIVTDAYGRWAAGGTRFFDEVIADEVIWTIKGSGPSAGTYHGREAFMAHAVRPFFARLSTPVRPRHFQIWADGAHVIAQWEGHAVARDGQPYRNEFVWIFRMRNGKAIEVTAFLDLTRYDDVLRRIPSPAPE